MPGEITSQAGWPPTTPRRMRSIARSSASRRRGIRVSLFVDPEEAPVELGRAASAPIASSSTPSRSRARSRQATRAGRASFARYVAAAELAHASRPRHQRRPRSRSRTTSRCSGRCRIWTKCRSATRSISHALWVGLDRVGPRLPRGRYRYDCDRHDARRDRIWNFRHDVRPVDRVDHRQPAGAARRGARAAAGGERRSVAGTGGAAGAAEPVLDERRAADLERTANGTAEGRRGARTTRQPVLRRPPVSDGNPVVRSGARDRSEERERQHGSGGRVLLHERFRSRAQADRPLTRRSIAPTRRRCSIRASSWRSASRIWPARKPRGKRWSPPRRAPRRPRAPVRAWMRSPRRRVPLRRREARARQEGTDACACSCGSSAFWRSSCSSAWS